MTSTPAAPATTSKRQTSTSSVPLLKPQCKIHSTATVADKAQITGSHLVEIGADTVIHPYAKIRAERGNVFIGAGSIVSEKAVVGVPGDASSTTAEEDNDTSDLDVVIGSGVNIEGGAVVEARKIGDHSTIEVYARVGRGAVVGKWCTLAPLCEVADGEVLDDYTVVFGPGRSRIDVVVRDREEIREMKVKGREKEVELLGHLIPDASAKFGGG